MKILIAVDGSAYTMKAVEHVVGHLDWFRGHPELHLLHVKVPIAAGRSRAFLGESKLQHYYDEDALEAMMPAEKVLQRQNIPYQATYKIGDIAEEIRAYAEKNNFDMIVMGSHGHGALQGLMMGSIATKVLATTTVPVLIVR